MGGAPIYEALYDMQKATFAARAMALIYGFVDVTCLRPTNHKYIDSPRKCLHQFYCMHAFAADLGRTAPPTEGTMITLRVLDGRLKQASVSAG